MHLQPVWKAMVWCIGLTCARGFLYANCPVGRLINLHNVKSAFTTKTRKSKQPRSFYSRSSLAWCYLSFFPLLLPRKLIFMDILLKEVRTETLKGWKPYLGLLCKCDVYRRLKCFTLVNNLLHFCPLVLAHELNHPGVFSHYYDQANDKKQALDWSPEATCTCSSHPWIYVLLVLKSVLF